MANVLSVSRLFCLAILTNPPVVEFHGAWGEFAEAMLRRWRRLNDSSAPRVVIEDGLDPAMAYALQSVRAK